MDTGADQNGNPIWPRNGAVLFPPTLHYNRYIKTHHERQGDKSSILHAVGSNILKKPVGLLKFVLL